MPVKHVAVTTVWCHYHYIVTTKRRTLIIEANQTPFSNTMAWFHFQDLNMHHVYVNMNIFVDIHVCYMCALHILLKKKTFCYAETAVPSLFLQFVPSIPSKLNPPNSPPVGLSIHK